MPVSWCSGGHPVVPFQLHFTYVTKNEECQGDPPECLLHEVSDNGLPKFIS